MTKVSGQTQSLKPKCAEPEAQPEAWFPLAEESGEYGEITTQSMAYARALCGGCPIIEECLDSALTRGETYGIWGGLTTPEREQLRVARTTADHQIRKLIADEEQSGVAA